MSLGLLRRAPDQVSASRSTPRAVSVHPRYPPAVLLAENDGAAGSQGLAVGGAGLLAKQLERAIGVEPKCPLGLDILEKQRSVRRTRAGLR